MKQKKILAVIGIVDDDESVRDSISSLLRSAGYKTESFESAEAYLNSDRASEPNCLLLDVRMPGLSGLQLQSELNHQKVLIPVFFITAHSDEQLRERALSEGPLRSWASLSTMMFYWAPLTRLLETREHQLANRSKLFAVI
jgi:FixJ family two-component response regulator